MYGISSLFPLIFTVFVIFIVVQDPMRLYLFFIKLIKFLLSKNICFLSNLITPEGEENFHVACLVLNWITVACYFILTLKVLWESKKGRCEFKKKLLKNMKIFSVSAFILIIHGLPIFSTELIFS